MLYLTSRIISKSRQRRLNSSDAIRCELFGSEEDQRNPDLVFKTLREQANSSLTTEKSVIKFAAKNQLARSWE